VGGGLEEVASFYLSNVLSDCKVKDGPSGKRNCFDKFTLLIADQSFWL
jgi:hypothetical protein